MIEIGFNIRIKINYNFIKKTIIKQNILLKIAFKLTSFKNLIPNFISIIYFQ